ncbi:hypothetical protein RCL_jg27613.t1 [Rhizophagus clarus]|uniref:Uncharacterized protein n=1 Tax=Rhizophagus clarus TaxID=94130 RepID=A0A8H3LXG9_9GLOM|nr:hypothetical protein RCL_jg27613.t1 [Rhizophagus clarus]
MNLLLVVSQSDGRKKRRCIITSFTSIDYQFVTSGGKDIEHNSIFFKEIRVAEVCFQQQINNKDLIIKQDGIFYIINFFYWFQVKEGRF